MITLKSLKTKNLSRELILQICKLKNSNWKTTILSQQLFFKKNCKSQDLHNLLYLNEKLIGYTLLRKRIFKYISVINKYLLFDTMIIHKKYRKQKLGATLMNFNNSIIKKENIVSYLFCKKKLTSFYKKFHWKLENKKKFYSNNITNKEIMSFNSKKKNLSTSILKI